MPPAITASFTGTGTGTAADFARLTGGSASGDTVTVNVVIGGPTTSSDLYSFAFDLVLGDTTVAQYVSSSVTAGTALTVVGLQSVEALASTSGSRVVVGVSKTNGGGGNGIPMGEPVVVSLTFRLLKTGSTTLAIAGAPGGSPECLDSLGIAIPSITFDAGNATLTGS
jgi:hypothetical protein